MYFNLGEPTNPALLHLPLLGSPLPICAFTVAYMVFVLWAGPSLLKNRPAYNVKYQMLIYNAVQIIFNIYIVFLGVRELLYHRTCDIGCCETLLPNDHPRKQFEVMCSYLYFLNKVLDCLDTVFFVLRKSFRQITFLHVYHHVLMVNMSYVFLRTYGTGGHAYSLVILNSAVHGFMYSYYFVAALKPSMRDAVWWKKYITRLQLMQFVLLIMHNLYPLFYRPNCSFPVFWLLAGLWNSGCMLLMFAKLYWKAYMRP